MKRKILKVTLGIAIIASLSGCSNTDKQISLEVPEKEQTEILDTQGKNKEIYEETQNIDNTPEVLEMTTLEKAATMIDKFNEKGENILYSPLSLDMALGLVSEGSVDETRKQLDNYLLTENYNEKASKIIKYTEEISDEENKFEIANSIWVDKSCSLKQSYQSVVENTFKATAKTLDIKNDPVNSAAEINEWVDNKTHGLIKEIIIPSALSSDTKSVLVNSIYFNALWAEKWETSEDSKLQFTNLNAKVIETDLLYGNVDTYFENKKATAFGKYYKNGLMFIGVLPKNEGEFNISELNLDELLENEKENIEVYAEMPKLDYEFTSYNLTEHLKDFGVTDIFNSESKLTEIIEPNKDIDTLVITDIIQKCRIILDEEKTEAAAVTAIIMANCTSIEISEKEYKEVILDRPFAYMIYDTVNKEVVFIGKYVDAK